MIFQPNLDNKCKTFNWDFRPKIKQVITECDDFQISAGSTYLSRFGKFGLSALRRQHKQVRLLTCMIHSQFLGVNLDNDGRKRNRRSKQINFRNREKSRAMAFLDFLSSHDFDAKLNLYDIQPNRRIKKGLKYIKNLQQTSTEMIFRSNRRSQF